MERSSTERTYRMWLGVLISLICLVAIFIFIDPAQVWAALRDARYGYLGLSAVSLVVFMLMRAVRWRFMLQDAVAYRQVFHIQNIGYMLTMILPLRLGDVARAVLIGGVPPVTVPQGVSTMIVERFLDLLFMVTLLPLTLSQVPTLPVGVRSAAQGAGIIAISGTVTLVIAASQQTRLWRLIDAVLDRFPFLDRDVWSDRTASLFLGLSSLTSVRSALILLILSVVLWVPVIGAYYWGLVAVRIEPSAAMAGFVVVAAALSIAAPSSPGQVGVYHAGVIAALTQILRQPEAQSASFAFLYHALSFFLNILLGLIGLRLVGATLDNVVKMARRSAGRRV